MSLLTLPSDVLEKHLLPRLSCRQLGVLALTCTGLRTAVLSSPVARQLAEALQVLDSDHELFSCPAVGTWLARQARARAAFAAGPDAWAWFSFRPAGLAAPGTACPSLSPDGAWAAASTGDWLLLWQLTRDAPQVCLHLAGL